jgi:hypothetical protein
LRRPVVSICVVGWLFRNRPRRNCATCSRRRRSPAPP